MDPTTAEGRDNRLDARLLPALRAAFDLVAVGAGFTAAGFWMGPVSFPGVPDGAAGSAAAATCFALLLLAVFRWQGLYRMQTTVFHLEEMEQVVKGMAIAGVLVLASAAAFLPPSMVSAPFYGAAACSAALVLVERRLLTGVVGRIRSRFDGTRRVLIYGCGDAGQLLMKKLLQASYLGREVVGFVDDYARPGRKLACRVEQYVPDVQWVPVVGRGDDLPELVDRLDVDELLVTTSTADLERVRTLTQDSDSIRVGYVPDLGSVRADQLEVENVGALPLLQPVQASKNVLYRCAKRGVDLGLGAILLAAFSPVWAVIATAIKLESDGPVLFRQTRVGRGGRRFTVYKFRTLQTDAAPYTRSQSVHDPRATRVGRVLRLTGLDEVPQLLNVLRGEMSLVGPRPEMPFIVEGYSDLERLRLDVKPGITGVWQLSPDREGAAIHENLEYDLFYIRYQSLLLDLLILVETVFFTLELLAGAAHQVLLGGIDAAPSVPDSVADYGPAPDQKRGALVVLLDQRRNGETPGVWKRVIPSAARLAVDRDMVLEVVSARSNVTAFDELLQQHADPNSDIWRRVRYLAYENRDGVREAVRSAELLISDLEVVREIAMKAGVRLIWVGEDAAKTNIGPENERANPATQSGGTGGATRRG